MHKHWKFNLKTKAYDTQCDDHQYRVILSGLFCIQQKLRNTNYETNKVIVTPCTTARFISVPIYFFLFSPFQVHHLQVAISWQQLKRQQLKLTSYSVQQANTHSLCTLCQLSGQTTSLSALSCSFLYFLKAHLFEQNPLNAVLVGLFDWC